MSANKKIGLNGIRNFLESLFQQDVHAMRVLSMANATLGVLSSASLAVHAIVLRLPSFKGERGHMSRGIYGLTERLGLSENGIDSRYSWFIRGGHRTSSRNSAGSEQRGTAICGNKRPNMTVL